MTSCEGGAVESGPSSAVHRLYDASNKIPTNKSGTRYREQCEDAGVPVPRTLVDETDGWVNRGSLSEVVLETSLEAELWVWESDAGICMALPRWNSGNEAQLFGLICFGYETGNTCFWDNDGDNDPLARYQAHTIDDLIGGAALEENAQGICSNCHAGENPFIVLDPAPDGPFYGLWGISGDAWPTPIVHEDWIGNPGPISSLGPVPSGQGKCTECHNEMYGMRFPLVLADHTGAKGYCEAVLAHAIGKTEKPPSDTMPPYYASTSAMSVQAERFWDYCEQGPPSDYSEEVDFDPPKPSVLSPLGVGPYYECAQRVAVQHAVLGATISLWVGTEVPLTKLATSPTVEFELTKPLKHLDIVFAKQTLAGIESANAFTTASSLAHPPAPTLIHTPLYACAGSVAVDNLPGATVVVEHHRGNTTVQVAELETSHQYSSVELPDGDFEAGDVLFARQTLCDTSAKSASETVETFTGSMQVPSIGTVLAGQPAIVAGHLVQGGGLELAHDTEGVLFSTPSNPSTSRGIGLPSVAGVIDPVEAGDTLTLTHRLCPDDVAQVEAEVIACDPASLAPAVLPAFGGNSFIVVEDGIPGARVDVYDENLNHIASTTGPDVVLTRNLVKDEKIWVTQTLPGCDPTTATHLTAL